MTSKKIIKRWWSTPTTPKKFNWSNYNGFSSIKHAMILSPSSFESFKQSVCLLLYFLNMSSDESKLFTEIYNKENKQNYIYAAKSFLLSENVSFIIAVGDETYSKVFMPMFEELKAHMLEKKYRIYTESNVKVLNPMFKTPKYINIDSINNDSNNVNRHTAIDVLCDLGYDMADINKAFDGLYAESSSQTEYSLADLSQFTQTIFNSYLIHYIVHDDLEKVTKIFDLYQETFRIKSFNYMKEIKEYISEKARAKTRKFLIPFGVHPLITLEYVEYYKKKFNKDIKRILADKSRSTFALSIIKAYSSSLLTNNEYESLIAMFNKYFSGNDCRNYDFYYIMLGKNLGIVSINQAILYFRQNLNMFDALIHNLDERTITTTYGFIYAIAKEDAGKKLIINYLDDYKLHENKAIDLIDACAYVQPISPWLTFAEQEALKENAKTRSDLLAELEAQAKTETVKNWILQCMLK